jgi:adenylylsulfate kinase-like enzyme
MTATTSLFIGRWQVPALHAGHRALIDTALDEGKHVVIALRDTPLGADNPYPIYIREQMIRHTYGNGVQTVTIPNPGGELEICYGRQVGYTFRQITLSPELEAVSGTVLRNTQKQVIWLTGNSGAGKTTLAYNLKDRLQAVVLDGDEMRASISLGAGFSMADRLKHNLRVARLARVLVKQQNVIVSVIAPAKEARTMIDGIVSPIWVYVKKESLPFRPDYPYEPPENPDIVANMDTMGADEVAEYVSVRLREAELCK